MIIIIENNNKMKIYTKKGDTGTTSLYDGTKVTKHNVIIQSVGELDEFNSEIGCILAYYNLEKDNEQYNENHKYYNLLNNVQSELFDMGSILANDPNKRKQKQIFDQNNEFITIIEKYIDEMTVSMPKLNNFILPGGNLFISSIHRARTVCRRAEGKITLIKYDPVYFNQDTDELSVNNINRCLAYINRLSDYLFTLARYTAFISNIPEIIYKKSRIIL
jgi:cob(I)alamin adenosyltransferase